MDDLKIKCLKGREILSYIPYIANLRIEVFKEYPYLYEGNLEYEMNYLKIYTLCEESILVIVSDKNKIVGISTAIPLECETEDCKKTFIDHQLNIKEIFYLGESILLKPYRGKNIYKHFFSLREAAARYYGSKITAFCGVERLVNDPRKPKDFKPLDKIWQHFGYVKHPELRVYYEWKEIGEYNATKKPLSFWLKQL